MEFSSEVCKSIKAQVRARVRADAQTERELERGIEKYRQWYSSQRLLGSSPLAVLAEGDSWSRYIIGKAVIFYVARGLGIEILNLAWPGDEVREMLTGKQIVRLGRELRRGPASRRKYEFLLFSGGGNDLVGQDRFYKWLNDYESGMSASELVNDQALSVAFAALELRYQELIALRDRESPVTTLLLHGYDFAIPSGIRACGQGPWLLPGLKLRRINGAALRREVVKEFLLRFDRLLRRIAAASQNVEVMPTQGVLADKHWDNELHPTNPGFSLIADVFLERMCRSP